jgi:hypothetical protein
MGQAPATGKSSAAVSEAWIDATAHAATSFATGGAAVAEAVSASVAALTGEVLTTMFLTKLKWTAALVLAAGLVATGVGVLAQQQGGGGPQPAAEGGQATAPARMKYEIRIWKDGASTGGPIVVEQDLDKEVHLNTPYGVIDIHPASQPDPLEPASAGKAGGMNQMMMMGGQMGGRGMMGGQPRGMGAMMGGQPRGMMMGRPGGMMNQMMGRPGGMMNPMGMMRGGMMNPLGNMRGGMAGPQQPQAEMGAAVREATDQRAQDRAQRVEDQEQAAGKVMAGMMMGMGHKPSQEQRLGELERKLDEILKTLESLKPQQARDPFQAKDPE